MDLLENIIRQPIFFQSVVFVLQFSIFLYEFEMVSRFSNENIYSPIRWRNLLGLGSAQILSCFGSEYIKL